MSPQNVWITGASRGLGAALVSEYASCGARVFMTARNARMLDEVARESGYPTRCHACPADVTKSQDLENTVKHIEAVSSGIDLAILNAGTYVHAGIDDFSADSMRELFEINVFAVAGAIELLLPAWRARGFGTFVIVGSVAGDVGLPYAASYSASKAALRRMTESLYPELKREGIAMHLVSPGFIDTPLTAKNDFPMPFMVSPAKAAREIRSGIEQGKFEIRFPLRMSLMMRLMAALPYRLQFAIEKRMLR